MTIAETIADLAEQLEQFSDWEDRYAHIIAMGKHLQQYPEEFRSDDFLVRGCQSRVWLHPSMDQGVVHFDADSEALIVKGLVAMLMKIYNHRTPDEILSVPSDFVSRLGLDAHLSQNRANVLSAMMKPLALYALAYKVSGASS
ncbi:MAG: SufE family protein [Candidatus Kapaibacteriota bacterium]